MKACTLDSLIKKYTEKTNHHGFEAILGNPHYRKYHERQEKKYDRLIIEIVELYLEEYGKSEWRGKSIKENR